MRPIAPIKSGGLSAVDRPLGECELKISIIIPCFNERETIASLLTAIEQRSNQSERECIIVDDGSTDGTPELLTNRLADCFDCLITHDRNRGKGAAIQSGLRVASGDAVVIQDADLEYDPAEYPTLLAPIGQDRADVVYGSRFWGNEERRVGSYWHAKGNGFVTALLNMLADVHLTDMATCYKVFRREVIADLELSERGFGFDPEVTARVARAGWRIVEVPISYQPRDYSAGKKFRWRDRFRILYCIVRYNAYVPLRRQRQ